MSLPTRKIGSADVPAIGYGAMGLSAFYGKLLPDEERFKILDAVYESGCRFWDTSDVYGDSEVLLGKWFKRTGKRNDIFLATKFGYVLDPSAAAKGFPLSGSPEFTLKALDESLRKLGVDHIDLWYQHRPDANTPIEITVRAMAEAVKSGKVKYIGLSECSADTLRRAHAVHPIAAIQMEYNPFTLDIEDPAVGVFELAKKLGVTIVVYSPIGRGILTGRYKSPDDFDANDIRRMLPRYSQENFPKILKIVDTLESIGKKHSATAGQVALAWLLAQGDNIIPIPGTTKEKNLKENIGALEVKLSPEEVQEIRRAAKAAGADRVPRMPERLKHLSLVDTVPLQE